MFNRKCVTFTTAGTVVPPSVIFAIALAIAPQRILETLASYSTSELVASGLGALGVSYFVFGRAAAAIAMNEVDPRDEEVAQETVVTPEVQPIVYSGQPNNYGSMGKSAPIMFFDETTGAGKSTPYQHLVLDVEPSDKEADHMTLGGEDTSRPCW